MTNLSLYVAALIVGTSFSAPARSQSTAAIYSSNRIAAIEQQFVYLINTERWDRNLRPLVVNPLLTRAARAHSQEMAQLDYFDHISPTPGFTTPMDRYLKELGHIPTWAEVGENLLYCSVVDVDLGHRCLMNSPHHRENILYPKFEQVGVGAYVDVQGHLWVTEMFLDQID